MIDRRALEMMALQAVGQLLQQQPMIVTHPQGWVRPEFWPLPIKREAPRADGVVVQGYRPMAILEFVNETLANDLRSARMKGDADA